MELEFLPSEAKDKNKVKICHRAVMKIRRMEARQSLGNHLLSKSTELGYSSSPPQVFNLYLNRNSSSWNSQILGYLATGKLQKGLDMYKQMQQHHNFKPWRPTVVALLKACSKLRDISTGSTIHSFVGSFSNDLYIGTALVDMYGKCGFLSKAQDVFDNLSERNVISWTTLIGRYTKHGYSHEALLCYDKMQDDDIRPDAYTFTYVLKALGDVGDVIKGQEIHTEIVRQGLLEKDLLVGSSLVDMYATSGVLSKAQEVFDKLPARDVVTWTTLVTGYTKYGLAEAAISTFDAMQHQGFLPNGVTFSCSLKACGLIGDLHKSLEMHADICRRSEVERDQLVGNALVDVYVKCACLEKAREVFERLQVRDVVSWNALIGGYAKYYFNDEALASYDQMQLDGISSDATTLVSVLKACGNLGAIDKGQELHAEICRRALHIEDVIANALVDMYGKCGLISKAREIFDKLTVKSVVTYNVLLGGYLKHGLFEIVLACFDEMQLASVIPDVFTFQFILKACGSIGAVEKGQTIHKQICREHLSTDESAINNFLVDMYAKCGSATKAQEVFDKSPVKDSVSWTALITGYGQLGKYENTFSLFERMERENIRPNAVTFASILNTCSHAGLVEIGELNFLRMILEFDIIPSLEHYTCIFDLLSRTGQVDKAVALINRMPLHPDIVVWHTLLGACLNRSDPCLGNQAFQHALGLDEMNAASYVVMSNISVD